MELLRIVEPDRSIIVWIRHTGADPASRNTEIKGFRGMQF
jgi:hypothetical protein